MYLGSLRSVACSIAGLVVTGVGALFFYYTFFFFFSREIPIRQLYLNLIFAAIPVQIAAMAAPIVPPVILIGMAATLYLLFIGFTENFHVERPKLKNSLSAWARSTHCSGPPST